MANGIRTGDSWPNTKPVTQRSNPMIETTSEIANAVIEHQSTRACFSVGQGKFIRENSAGTFGIPLRRS